MAAQSLIERYLAGRLSPDETVAFEDHYVSCRRCQDDLRLGVATRRGLAAIPARRESVRRRVRPAHVALGLAAAAGVAGVLLIARDRVSEDVARLGGVLEPPVYLGVAVRGIEESRDSLFAAAMSAYAARRYEEAAKGLGEALAAGVDSAPALFFRAASLLMMGRNRDAEQGFRDVIALGETPYTPEASFFRAKALLRLGNAREAGAELRVVAAKDDELGNWARALADSLGAPPRR